MLNRLKVVYGHISCAEAKIPNGSQKTRSIACSNVRQIVVFSIVLSITLTISLSIANFSRSIPGSLYTCKQLISQAKPISLISNFGCLLSPVVSAPESADVPKAKFAQRISCLIRTGDLHCAPSKFSVSSQ